MDDLIGDITSEASTIFRRSIGVSTCVRDRRFRALFGVNVRSCARLWQILEPYRPAKAKVKHLLWSLMFLKTYANEVVLSALTGVDEKTQRFWVWNLVHAISRLPLVRKTFLQV